MRVWILACAHMCVVDGQVKRQRSKAGQKISSYETSSMPRVASSGPTNQPRGQIQALTYKYRTQIQTWFYSETYRKASSKIYYFLLRISPPEKTSKMHNYWQKCKATWGVGSTPLSWAMQKIIIISQSISVFGPYIEPHNCKYLFFRRVGYPHNCIQYAVSCGYALINAHKLKHICAYEKDPYGQL